MKVLSVQEYNTAVKAYYPEAWAQSSKTNGFMAVTDDFADGFWGVTRDAAINKFNRVYNKIIAII